MKLFSKILLVLFMASLARARGSVSPDRQDCSASNLAIKTQLSCVSCALKNMGRPVDDNYLALIGLVVRENVALLPGDEKTTFKNPSRSRIDGTSNEVKQSDGGPIEFTARAKYQRGVLQILLAGGYCAPGKVKAPKSDYANVIERVNSTDVAYGDGKKKRDKAAVELGQANFSTVSDEFYTRNKKDGKSFLEWKPSDQRDFFRNRRKSALSRGSAEDSYLTKSEMPSCLADIEANYSALSTDEETYATCTAVYDRCGIATLPHDDGKNAGALYRDNGARVGGDWCASVYGKPGFRQDGTPLPPFEDVDPKKITYIKSVGEIKTDGKRYWNSQDGTSIDASRITYDGKGNMIIPLNAINRNPTTLPVTNPTPTSTPTWSNSPSNAKQEATPANQALPSVPPK